MASGSGSESAPLTAVGLATPPAGPPPLTGSEVVELGYQSAPSGAAGVVPLARERKLIEQRAEQRLCQLSTLGAPGANGCEGGWMATHAAILPTSTGVPETATALVSATAGGGGGSGNAPGNAAGGGHPDSPSPGPAPGGAAGGVAAGGSGGGVGLTGLLTLAGLLLLAGPRALRRLRLSCRPYRTAFFVLIPERPG